jgi:hypothetical protein
VWTRIWQGTAIMSILFSVAAVAVEWLRVVSIIVAVVAVPTSVAVFYYQGQLQDADRE